MHVPHLKSILQDMSATVRKLSGFLGTTRTDDEISRIVEHCHIENMKKNEATNGKYQADLKPKDTNFGKFINTGMNIQPFILFHWHLFSLLINQSFWNSSIVAYSVAICIHLYVLLDSNKVLYIYTSCILHLFIYSQFVRQTKIGLWPSKCFN